jgi:hypothetical protein
MKKLVLYMLIAIGMSPVLSGSVFSQQVRLQKAVIAQSGARLSNSTTKLDCTVGQVVSGTSSNGQTVGRFGYWNGANPALSVSKLGTSILRSITISPNPAVSWININLTLASASDLELKLYNESGQYVETVFAGRKGEGRTELRYDTRSLPSGAYYLAAVMRGEMLQTSFTVVR